MPFEGSEKPSQRHEKVRRKLFHVMIDTSDLLPKLPMKSRRCTDSLVMLAKHSYYALES